METKQADVTALKSVVVKEEKKIPLYYDSFPMGRRSAAESYYSVMTVKRRQCRPLWDFFSL